jgi:uroporphyrinogen III methyltransferase/synthase
MAWPAFELLPPDDPDSIVQAIRHLNQFDTVVFISPAAVHAFASVLAEQGKRTDPEAARLPLHVTHWPNNCRVAVVGEGTRHAALTYLPHLDPGCLISPLGGTANAGSEALIQAWPRHESLPRHVLLVRAQKGRQKLTDWFVANGATVQDLVAYRRVEFQPSEDDWQVLSQKLELGCPLAVLFTSTEAVDVIVRRFEARPEFRHRYRSIQALCIHSRIEHALRERGFAHIDECTLEPASIANALRSATPSWMTPPAPIDILL